MAKGTVEKVEVSAEALQREQRRELHQLLGLLRSELTELSKTHGEQAKSIAGFARVAAHEATRTQPNPHLLELAIGEDRHLDLLALWHQQHPDMHLDTTLARRIGELSKDQLAAVIRADARRK